MNYNFLYNLDNEVNAVKNTLDKIGFYNENRYQVFLPKNFDIKNNDTEYIKESVLREYIAEDYKKISIFLEKQLIDNDSKIESAFHKLRFRLSKTFDVYLTKYGVGGNYDPPGRIILNFRAKAKEKLLKTIIHESIHLYINDLIIEYNIPHWKKEFIVDSIFEKVLPEINILQNFSIHLPADRIKEMEIIFNNYFPDVEDVIKNIGKSII